MRQLARAQRLSASRRVAPPIRELLQLQACVLWQARRRRRTMQAATVRWRARRTPLVIGSFTQIARPIGVRWAIPTSRAGTLVEVMAAYRCR